MRCGKAAVDRCIALPATPTLVCRGDKQGRGNQGEWAAGGWGG